MGILNRPRKLRNKRKLVLTFAKFFNPEKSPHTSWHINKEGQIQFTRIAKHNTERPVIIVHDSMKKRTPYIRQKKA